MSVWDMATVWNVRRLRVSADVAAEFAGEPFFTEVKSRLARAFAAEAHVLAVEVHDDDLAFDIAGVEPPTYVRTVYCYWSPSTTTIRLVGGQQDGCSLEFSRVGERVRVPEITGYPLLATEVNISMVANYDLDGWSEDDRLWLYALVRS